MPQSSPAKDWMFTINNPTKKDWKKIWRFPYRYLIFSIEMASTVHIQGFVQLEEKIRFTAVKKLHKQAHWEKRRGTPYEASHYCEKPVVGCTCAICEQERIDDTHLDGPYIDGFISVETQYKVHEIAKTIKEYGFTRAVERFPEAYLSMNRGFEALDDFYCPDRDYVTTVTVCWGEAGAGKTRYAMEGPSPYKFASFGQGTDFFGRYRPRHHETLVLDDFYGNWAFGTLLAVTDRYPTEVHTKGGFRQFLMRHIVITSNVPPNEWYKTHFAAHAEAWPSLDRRLHNIIHFTKAGYAIIRVFLILT